MRRPSATTPLLGRHDAEVNPFNRIILTAFWVFQLEWMALHVLVLATGLKGQGDEVRIFRVERILLYTLCLATMLEVLFEILVYANYTSLLRFTFTPRLYLRCNLIKIGCWTFSGIVTVIDDYLYDSSGHYLSYKGYSTAFAVVSMILFISPAGYAKYVEFKARKLEEEHKLQMAEEHSVI
ncbi:hypothetical protein V8E51_010520 [Hyaloscypha variabilis]